MMMEKKRSSVFNFYLRHILCLSLTFVLLVFAVVTILKKLLTPYYYDDLYKYVYESFENKRVALISVILRKDNDSLDRIINDQQFVSAAISKQIRMFNLSDYVKQSLFNTCHGQIKSFLWGAVCHQDNRIIVELPVKSSDNTLAHLSVELVPNISAWQPYRIISMGMFLVIFVITLTTIGLIFRFYYKFAKPIKSTVASLIASQEHLVPIDLKEALPMDELFNLASEIERYHGIVLQNESLAAIGSSTAMVAHDVRKPLAGMKILLSALPTVKDNPEQLSKMIANVDLSIARIETLLNEILDFSRDSSALEIGDHDPQSIITSAVSETLRNHPGSEIKFEYQLGHRHTLKVDGNRIIRALVNIMDNALDAMTFREGKSKGSLLITTDEKEFIRISIADSGPGMPEDVLSKVFDPFFTHGKKGGIGLGLAISNRVVSMHGCKIEARNVKDGIYGAEFSVSLPKGMEEVTVNDRGLIYDSNELKVFREEEARRVEYGDTINTAEFIRLNKERGRIARMLVVDDEPLFRETIRSMLSEIPQVRDHVKVIESDSGDMALALFGREGFDYLIVDIDFGSGEMDGYKLAETVLQNYPNTYVLIHSNKRREEMDREIRQVAARLTLPDVVPSFSSGRNVPDLNVPDLKVGTTIGTADTKFLGFLPKPMKSSELLQFLACKTFEIPNPPPLEKGGKGGFKRDILLLNDDSEYNMNLKICLKNGNTHIHEATSVNEAFQIFLAQQISGIVCDVNLGKGEPDGYDFLKKVRELNKDVPFVFASGYSAKENWPKARELGATGYLQNPFKIEELKVLLEV